MSVYPECYCNRRLLSVGGVDKAGLLEMLEASGISLNNWAKILFESSRFKTASCQYRVTIVELSVGNLGFPDGAVIDDIFESAIRLGLRLCPLELGPHLRLEYTDQPEGHRGKPILEYQAPYGSVTIASEALTGDDDFPRGFYLRRIEDVFWLRGYRSGTDHVWSEDDRFIFLEED